MNSSPLPRRKHTWRIALPIALLVTGVALSCWMACIGWGGQTEAQLIEEFIRKTETDLRRVLPPVANKKTSAADRLKITGQRPTGEFYVEVRVVAVGDFNAGNARAFATVARTQRGYSNVRVITVTTYSDATNPRTLVATFGENRAREIQRTLREKLPPTGPSNTGLPFVINVFPSFEGIVDVYNINAYGPFTSESAAAFVGTIQAVQKTLPGETRFFGTVSSNANRPFTILENFNTAAEK